MKRLLFIAFIFSIGIMDAQPKMVIEGGYEKNWGIVKPGDEALKHVFKIYNRGNDTLRIYSVKKTCGCTTAPLEKDRIEPGGYATLPVAVEIEDSFGKQKKDIYLSTNDPENRRKTLYLKFEVFVPLRAFPSYFGFGKSNVGKKVISNVTLTNNTDKPIKIIKIESTLKTLKLNIKEGMVIAPKTSQSVVAEYVATSPGRTKGTVAIKTDSEEVPVIELRVWGEFYPNQN